VACVTCETRVVGTFHCHYHCYVTCERNKSTGDELTPNKWDSLSRRIEWSKMSNAAEWFRKDYITKLTVVHKVNYLLIRTCLQQLNPISRLICLIQTSIEIWEDDRVDWGDVFRPMPFSTNPSTWLACGRSGVMTACLVWNWKTTSA